MSSPFSRDLTPTQHSRPLTRSARLSPHPEGEASNERLPGFLKARFQVISCVARDGVRRVWKAWDHQRRTLVALKAVYAPLGSPEARHLSAEFARLHRHAHPRLASALELGAHPPTSTVPGLCYFTQRWLEGPSLHELGTELTPQTLLECLSAMLEVIAYLHHHHLVGLDLRPEHIILTPFGWCLIDLDQAHAQDPFLRPDPMGTLPYVAPELLRGETVGPRSDLYSLGAIGYQALTGQAPPLKGEVLEDMAAWLTHSPLPAFSAEVLSAAPRVCAFVHALLARNPAQRPASALQCLELYGAPLQPALGNFPLPEAPLVGQGPLLEALDALARRTPLGGGLRLVGPPGSGRTRLLHAAAEGWRTRGIPVLLLDTSDHLARPLLEHLDLHLSDLECTLEPAEHAGQASQARLHSEEGSAHRGYSHLLEGPSESRQDRYLAHLLHLGGLSRPLAQHFECALPVLIDDADTLDAVSRLQLDLLAPLLEGTGLAVIVVENQAFVPTTRTLAPGGIGSLPGLELAPLTALQTRQLVDDLAPTRALTSEQYATLHTLTDGLPARIREAVRFMQQHPECPLEQLVPADDAARVREALATLSPQAGAVLRRASVLQHPALQSWILALTELSVPGAEATPERAAPEGAAAGGPAAATPAHSSVPAVLTSDWRSDSALQELLRLGHLVQEQRAEGQEAAFRFARESLRRALESTLAPGLRRSLHELAAELIEEQLVEAAADQAQAVAPTFLCTWIVDHWVAAELPERARPQLPHAIHHALSQLQLEEAVRLLDLQIQLSPHSPSLSLYYARRAELEADLGRLEPALASTGAGLELPQLPLAVRERLLATRGRALATLNRLQEAREALEAALEFHPARETALLLEPVPSTPVGMPHHRPLSWWHRLIWTYLRLRELEHARLALEHAALQVAPGSRDAVDQVRYELWWGLEEAGSLTTLIPRADEALLLAERLGYTRGLLTLYDLRLELAHRTRQEGEALELLQSYLERCQDVCDRSREAVARGHFARTLRALGRHLEALQQYEHAATLLLQLQNPDRALRQRLSALEMLLDEARIDRAAELLPELELLLERAPNPQHRTWLELLSLRLERLQAGPEPDPASLPPAPELERRIQALEASARELKDEGLTTLCRLEGIAWLELRQDYAAAQRQLGLLLGALPATLNPGDQRQIHRQALALHRRCLQALEPVAASTPAFKAADPTQATAGDGRETFPPPLDPPQQEYETSLVLPSPSASPARAEAYFDQLLGLFEGSPEGRTVAVLLSHLVGDLVGGRGIVALREPTGHSVLHSARVQAVEAEDLHHHIIADVLERGEMVQIPDLLVRKSTASLRSARDRSARSVLCVPVMQGKTCIGAVYVDHREVRAACSEAAQVRTKRVAVLLSELLQGLILASQAQARGSQPPPEYELIGTGAATLELRRRLERLLRYTREEPILFLGETGTGKTELARIFHRYSTRSEQPFVDVACPSIPDSLIEPELFGHSKGAFTGAVREGLGYLAQARAGTILLDEIGELPTFAQAKLLKAIDDRRYHRVGDHAQQQLEAQVITATNRDLEAMVEQGSFRLDLLSRIKVNTLRVPPLRERGREDIRLLACYAIEQEVGCGAQPPVRLELFLDRGAVGLLETYHWPDNVRQLLSLFKAAEIRGRLGEIQQGLITREELERTLLATHAPGSRLVQSVQGATWQGAPWQGPTWQGETTTLTLGMRQILPDPTELPLSLSLDELNDLCNRFKRQYVQRVVESQEGNIRAAARDLKCQRSTVYYMVAEGD